jgi:type IV pilus assembly protein PilM
VAGRTAVGLDIGTSGVRAAELSYGAGGISLERFGQVAVPVGSVRDGEVVDPAAVGAALRELWSATGFTSRKVVLGVANQRVMVRSVEVPWLPIEELRAGLHLHVADLLPTPVDQAVLDFHPLEEISGSRGRFLRGLLVAASRETVLTNVRCVEAARLNPVAVDLTSFAVLRALNAMSIDDPSSEALVDIGARVTNVVVHSAGIPRFVRILLMGGQDVTDALSERVGTSLAEAEQIKHYVGMVGGPEDLDTATRAVQATAEAFIDEIRGSLDYHNASNPQRPVSRVVLSGGGSLLRGLAHRLQLAVRVPVDAGDPLSRLRIGRTGLTPEQLDLVRPLAATPVGLALGAVR